MASSGDGGDERTRWHTRGRLGASTTADAHFLTVRQGLRRRRVGWWEVASISQERRADHLAGWNAVVRLDDGSTLTDLPGISTVDGTFSDETQAALNALTGYWQRAVDPEPEIRTAASAPASAALRKRRILTGAVMTGLGLSILAFSGAIVQQAHDHADVAGYRTATACSPSGVATASPGTWCRLTDYASGNNLTGTTTQVMLVPAVALDESESSIAAQDSDSIFYANFGDASALPPGIWTTVPLTAVVQAREPYAASVSYDGHTYQTADSPLVKYTTSSETLLATFTSLVFFLVWTVRRLDRRRGYVAEALFTGTCAAAFVATFGADLWQTGSTSITADWLTTTLVALAAAFVQCCRVQRRRQQGRAAG